MGGVKQIYQEKSLKGNNDSVIGRVCNGDFLHDSIELSFEDSTSSSATFSSSDVVDDASSTSTPSSSTSYGPLFELSELMAQLPIKRGISKHYQGKSESFGCLASVNSLEDLAKKGYYFTKRVKACNKSKYSPKPTISKKTSTTTTTTRVSFLNSSSSSSQLTNTSTFVGTCS